MYIPKFRYTFYKIPFMRGGIDVPVVATPGNQIPEMEKYFVTEIISEKQFSETQNQIVLANAAAVNNANYVRIARTAATEIQSDYDADTDPAFFWVEDVQIICTTKDSDGPRSAIITIAPDPWLTDFCDAAADINIRGRLKQSTQAQAGERISNPVEPITDFSLLNFEDVSGTAADDSLFDVVGVFTDAGGGILIFSTKTGKPKVGQDLDDLTTQLYYFAKVAFWRYAIQPDEANIAVKCIKLLVVPNSWIEWAKQGLDITLTVDTTLPEAQEIDAVQVRIKSNFSLKNVLSVSAPDQYLPKYNYFLLTPTHVIRLENTPYVLNPSYKTIANIYVGTPLGSNSDGIAIFLEVEGEIIDITDDFQADFAINDQALKQAQQKEYVALSVMTGVIGGIQGLVNSFQSKNPLGAIQSSLDIASAIMAPNLAYKTPSVKQGSGNVITAIYGQGIISIASTYQITNETQYETALSRFGYIYPNKPYIEINGYENIVGNFFSFENIDVCGIPGGQLSAAEIATDLIRGVKLKVV